MWSHDPSSVVFEGAVLLSIHCDLNVRILAGSDGYLSSRIALPVRSPSPRKRLYLKFPTIKTAAAPHTGGPSSIQERGRDSCLRAVLCYKRIFTSLKACMGCKRFFLKERKNVMFLNKIDVPYCLVVFFVVCPRLRPFWSVFGELALFWCSTAKRKSHPIQVFVNIRSLPKCYINSVIRKSALYVWKSYLYY